MASRKPRRSTAGTTSKPAPAKLVTRRAQLEQNIETLETYRESITNSDKEFYSGLIKRGICFVCYMRNGERRFAPSRFVGYADNSRRAHAQNFDKDGRDTNRAIARLLGRPPVHDAPLDREYERFCRSIGIDPPGRGNFDVARKYWVLS